MGADRLYVAVRPRGILECLDLAVMFCGRRPLAVVAATAVGALPCILLNRLLAGTLPEGVFPGYVLLGLEAAWASVPLTLYLGQAVFAERFSWRSAVPSFAGSLPALILFQGVLRAICLAIVFLAPLVFIGMYYLNQIILLEQPPLPRIWSRRTAINRRNFGHLLTLAMLDAAILVIGLPLVTGLVGAVSALWRGRPITWMPGLGAETAPLAAVFSWHGQIAFWSVCGLLTVLRFFTYLDARIRREGWDVELKLRAEKTYAGLPEAEPVRPATATTGRVARMAGWLAGLLLAATPGATAADGNAATPSGDGARRALSRHSFPWYDATRDRYRPLINPDRKDAPSSDTAEGPDGNGSGSGTGPGSGSGSGRGTGDGGRPVTARPPPSFSLPRFDLGNVGLILMIALFATAALIIVYLVVRYGLGRRDRLPSGGDWEQAEDDASDERLAALPAGIRPADGDLLVRAAAHAEHGEFEQAMICFHAWQLVELDRRGGLTLARGKTNGQYAAEVTVAAPAVADLFRRSSRLFEDAFFGDLPVPRADFLAVWENRGRIESFSRHAGA